MFLNETNHHLCHFGSIVAVVPSRNQGVDTDIDKKGIMLLRMYPSLPEHLSNDNARPDTYRLIGFNHLTEVPQNSDNLPGIIKRHAGPDCHNGLLCCLIEII